MDQRAARYLIRQAQWARVVRTWVRVSAAGNRTDRANLRVATLISIWFMAHLPSQSSATDASQLGRACSLPSKLRSLGRSISILPPWKPILPFAFPQRCARQKGPRAWRGPLIACASCSIISPSASMPEARHNNSKLAEMFAIASSFSSRVGTVVDVISFCSWRCSPLWNQTPSTSGSRRATPLRLFQHQSVQFQTIAHEFACELRRPFES